MRKLLFLLLLPLVCNADTLYSLTTVNGGYHFDPASSVVVISPPPIPVVSCGGLSLTAVDVQVSFNSPGVSYQQKSMVTGQVYSMHFKTPPSAVSAAISEIQVVEFAGAIPMRTMVLSPRQCDFSAASDNIVAGGSVEPQIYMSIGKANSYGYPSIKANTDYYITLKNANPAFPNVDTCAAGAQCGFAMTMYGTR